MDFLANLPATTPWWAYLLIVLAVVLAPILVGIGVGLRLFAIAQSKKTEADITARMKKIEDDSVARRNDEAERLKRLEMDHQTLAVSNQSVQSVMNVLTSMVEERKENTTAIRENTEVQRAALHLNETTRTLLQDWDERQVTFFRQFDKTLATLATSVTASSETAAARLQAAGEQIAGVVPSIAKEIKPLVERVEALVIQVSNHAPSIELETAINSLAGKIDILIDEVRQLKGKSNETVNGNLGTWSAAAALPAGAGAGDKPAS